MTLPVAAVSSPTATTFTPVVLAAVSARLVVLFTVGFLVSLVPIGIGGLSLWRWHVLRQDEANQYSTTFEGPIEVAGPVRPADDGDSIRGSVSTNECVVCEIEAQRYSSGQHGGEWHTVESGAEYHPFVVESPVGDVRVEPADADFVLDEEVVSVVDKGEEPTGRTAAFFDAVGVDASEGVLSDVDPTGDLFGSKYRVVERRVDVGEAVYVAGTADTDADVTVGFDSPDALVRASEDPPLQERLFGFPFIVGDGGESAVRDHFRKRGLLFLVGGVGFFLLTLFLGL